MDKAATSGSDLPKFITEAMTAIEDEFEPLKGVLPKDYGIFDPRVLEDLMRLFNSERIKQASGDVFGRIYEYFLAKALLMEPSSYAFAEKFSSLIPYGKACPGRRLRIRRPKN